MRVRDILQLFLLAAIWGSSYLFIRIVTPAIGIAMTAGIRIVVAAVIMVLLFAYLKKLPEYKSLWKQYFILGALNLVLPFTLVSYAIAHLNASIGAILNAMTPLFTMVISSLWFHERMTVKKVVGLFIGLTGLTVLVGWIPLEINGKVVTSIVFLLLASLSYGLGAVYAKAYMKKTEPLKTATGQTSAAALLVIPFLHNPASVEAFSFTIVLAILVLAILCTALAYTLYFKLIANIGSTNASLVTLLVPVFSLLWSRIFLHEPLTPALIIGLLLILSSLKLVLSPVKQ